MKCAMNSVSNKFHLIPTIISSANINTSFTTTVFVAYIFLIFLISTASCFTQIQTPPSDTTRNSLFEGKTRLGSTPPTCHNKCNQCHPCLAVQVPTMPSHNRAEPSQHRINPMDYYEPSPYSRNRYSNYKPLGWKCRCGSHFYNP